MRDRRSVRNASPDMPEHLGIENLQMRGGEVTEPPRKGTPMLHLAFVTQKPEMAGRIETIMKDWPPGRATVTCYQVRDAHEAADLTIEGDVVICRGLVPAILRQKYGPALPLVELLISGYDVLRTLNQCRRLSTCGKAALLTSAVAEADLRELTANARLDIYAAHIRNHDEVRQHLEKARAIGVDVVAGSTTTCLMAEQMALKSVVIESGQESVRLALEEAARLADVSWQTRAETERLKIIIDSMFEGALAVDQNGLITASNMAARALLNPGRDNVIAGQHIDAVLPGSSFAELLTTGQSRLGTLHRREGGDLVSNMLPINVDGRIMGAVSTFQPVNTLQDVESRVRASMHDRGHKARYTFADCLGESATMRTALSRAARISSAELPLLIHGETGTGKEIVAQSVHNLSRRRTGPFVAVNCASLTENLLESELFGYVEGAFTGARRGGKAGLFEIANRGSIFLDEISEIPLSLQARLLRVLQENEVMRLGHDRVIPVDVRIIAASNKSLEYLVREGFFRQDLYYRLNVLSLTLPPLRERLGDIGLLAQHFLAESCAHAGRPDMVWAPGTLTLLEDYTWPGNVRELRNVCERIMVFATGTLVKPEDLRCALDAPSPSRPHRPPPGIRPTAEEVHKALHEAGGHHGLAASSLGISRTTLWRRLQKEGRGEG